MLLFAITTSKCWISNWTTVKQMLFVSNDRRMMSGEISESDQWWVTEDEMCCVLYSVSNVKYMFLN